MRHHKKKVTLDRKKAPRESMLKNMATSLVIYEKITTTEAKAKAIRPIVEKLVTIGKIKNLTNTRTLYKTLFTKKAVDKILEVLGPRYKERKGGYTKIIKLGPRKGDGAKVAQIKFC